MTAILKIIKSLYLNNGFTVHEIWQDDAYFPTHFPKISVTFVHFFDTSLTAAKFADISRFPDKWSLRLVS